MADAAAPRDFTLEPEDGERLANLAGPLDAHLRQIELRLGVQISNRGGVFRLSGPTKATALAERLLRQLWADTETEVLTPEAIHLRLGADEESAVERDLGFAPQDVAIKVKRGTIRGRGANQAAYLHAIATHDINFGIGPAGTGKTYLAVASAVEA
ncbi:MAG: PhoH family protein, partial [Xanthomonadaceae bacterium]|nr:PhoH family protein [Xanthomonadaceae bacterium]